MYPWKEKPPCVDPFLAESLVGECLGNALRQAGRIQRPVRLNLRGWLARYTYRTLCGLGDHLVALGQRLRQYGAMTTRSAGERP
ncbi:MAG TPA: hypothetical protein ENK08_06880 [Chloroflexi bacterium]|nr:hypothetical protein [Chloroflexota bacterium]